MKRKWITGVFLAITIGWGQQFPKYLYGVASWYGEEFAGKKTASGATYDPNLYTAAHRTLPFGTLVEVENLENGKKVQLTINDRGPFVDNRILDVSQKAAEDLGFLQKGTAYVKVTIIRLGEETTPSPSLSPDNTNTSFPQANQSVVLTNYITNSIVVTNYTTTSAPQAIVIPYEEKPVTQAKPNPSFILDE
ncbi:MAG: septal ring lytic transglycosylase RlpA family protein, partial [Brevinematales bacterium]